MKRRSVIVRAHWRSGAHIMCFQSLCYTLGTHPSPWFLALLLLPVSVFLIVVFLIPDIDKIIWIETKKRRMLFCYLFLHIGSGAPYIHMCFQSSPILSHIRVTIHYIILWHNKLWYPPQQPWVSSTAAIEYNQYQYVNWFNCTTNKICNEATVQAN